MTRPPSRFIALSKLRRVRVLGSKNNTERTLSCRMVVCCSPLAYGTIFLANDKIEVISSLESSLMEMTSRPRKSIGIKKNENSS